MKKILFLLLLFCLTNQVFGREFSEIYGFEGAYSKASLIQLLDEEKKAYQEKHQHETLLNIKYIESFIADIEKNNNQKLQKLLWIIENCRKEDFLIYTYANYHLGSLLNYLNSNQIAKYYALTAINSCKKHKVDNLLKLTYSLMASIYYNLKDYDKANTYYYLAFNNGKGQDNLFLASMLNNISLCKMQMGDLIASNSYIFRSLFYLNQIKNKSKDVQLFKIIVEGNLGSNYHKLNKLDLAKKYLGNEVSYYNSHQLELNNIYRPIQELIEIYTQEKEAQKVIELVRLVQEIENKMVNKNDQFNCAKLLYAYYDDQNDLIHIKEYADKIIQAKAFVADSIQRNSNELNNILYSQEIKHLKHQFKSNQQLLESTVKSKRYTTWFLIVFFSLISIIFILLYMERNRTIRKNEVIQKQKDELEENKRVILENEIKLKQEKITSLALNLSIKKETEKAFLHKIREIKRKRSIEIESVLIDLQQQVSNLLSIDSKNNETISDEENQKFSKYLKELHPNLTEQELILCVYFKLNLNSKEIASFTNMTPGTIRVYKSKIKDKIALEDQVSLNEYLADLSV